METLIIILIATIIVDIWLRISIDIFNNSVYKQYKDYEAQTQKVIEEWKEAVKNRDKTIETLNNKMLFNISMPDGRKFDVAGHYETKNDLEK